MESLDLLLALKHLGYPKVERDPLWWPSSGSFEVVIGAILTQNTQWRNVQKALENLKEKGCLSLESLCALSPQTLSALIKPSGFYNTKAQRLLLLAHAIKEEFGGFESFCEGVSRPWLLKQKGVGEESADAILCYACKHEAMTVDAYTARLLEALGFCFESYGEIQEWLICGLEPSDMRLKEAYGEVLPASKLYARYHGKIVEYGKDHALKGRSIDTAPLRPLLP